MKRQILLVLSLSLAAVSVSFADSVSGNFNLDTSLSAVPSQGEVTFTLNANGTIAASLMTYYNTIYGFGFNSAVTDLPESNFTTTPDNPVGWIDSFGFQPSGFGCYVTNVCGFDESWTIGNPGDYTSVLQALNGPAGQSTVAFFLYDSTNASYGAQTQAAVPEPGSLALAAIEAGLFGVLAALRRKLPRRNHR